jgi:hypothetical protein
MKNTLSQIGLIFLGIVLTLGFIQAFPYVSYEASADPAQPTFHRDPSPFRVMSDAMFSKYSRHQKQGVIAYALPRDFDTPNNQPLQIDSNGDGLMDLWYSRKSGDPGCPACYTVYQYLLQSTGRGFKIAYACKAQRQSGSIEHRYYGDCADYSIEVLP